MINKITRATAKELGINFDELINDMDERSYEEHRRGSNFYVKSIVDINEKWFPEVPRDLDGYWETNRYVWDTDYGHDKYEITELNRVVKKEKVITETYWEKVID